MRRGRREVCRRLQFILIVACATIGLGGVSSRANVTVDFDSLASHDRFGHGIGGHYLEDGVLVTAEGSVDSAFGYWGAQSPHYGGSTALGLSSPGDAAVVTTESGIPFDLLSIDLSELFSVSNGRTPVTFLGTREDGSLVQVTHELDGTFGFETFAFDDFRDLVRVEWTQLPDYHQFDNVVLNWTEVGRPTHSPAPGAAMLGIIGVGMIDRLRRRLIETT